MKQNIGPVSVYANRIPFFSIICCTYNRAHLLDRAIQSVFQQDEQDWELVVIDDGSIDDTAQLLLPYAHEYPNIRVLFQSHRGLSASRNAGLLSSCGLYVTFLDSDDEYLPTHLSVRKQACVENPHIPFIHGGIEVIGDDSVPDKDNPTKRIPLSECAIGGTFVIRRELALALGGFADVSFADDAEFFARAESQGVAIARIDAPTYRYYRDTPDSMCNTYTV